MPRPPTDFVRALLVFGLLIFVAVPLVAVWHAFGPGRYPIAHDFALVDQTGRTFRLSQDRGKPVVLFFGYTHCPDVCPTTLAAIAHARSTLGPAGRDVAVLFVTVDPARDTPRVLQRYVALFDPSFAGLSGTDAQLAPVYSAYHVWHQALPSGDSAAGYLVSHSTEIYFIGRDGRIRTQADWSDGPDAIKSDIEEIV